MTTEVRVLSKLPTGDPIIDRWQDHVLATLNPVLRRLTDLVDRLDQLESRLTALEDEVRSA